MVGPKKLIWAKRESLYPLLNRDLNVQRGTEIHTVIHSKSNEHNLEIIFLWIIVFKVEFEYKKIIQRTEIHGFELFYENNILLWFGTLHVSWLMS